MLGYSKRRRKLKPPAFGEIMAISPGFEYDIFISYTHVDNQESWVTEFEERLGLALQQRLGGAGKSLKIFFDREATGANDQLSALLAAVRQSALFLAIGSPSFVDSEWTKDELAVFAAQTADLSRIFLVEFLPLSEGDKYPPPIHDHIRLEFWKFGKYRHTPIPLSPTADAEDYSTKIRGLAMDVREKLTSLRVLPAVALPRPGGTAPAEHQNKNKRSADVESADPPVSKPAKIILLAQSTDDVEEEAEQLRSYLRQFEDQVTVLPPVGYPQGGEAFRESVQMDMRRAGLFVQLLGKRAGRTPPDLLEGYTRCQLEAAKAAGVPIMQWRRPDLDVANVTDPAYHTLLTAETVVASGLEAFKKQVLSWVRTPIPKPRVMRSSTVFINADLKRDMGIAKEVEREFVRKSLADIFWPISGVSADENKRDLEANLTECDILVFICGETPLEWIRSQLRYYSKIKYKREAKPRLLMICNGPPPKGDLGVSFPDAHVIDCPDGWNLEPIRSLISGIEP